MTGKPTVALLISIVVVTLLTACEQSEAEGNTRIMEEAARSLAFSTPDNRAYMLEKIAGAAIVSDIQSKVAAIFGYVDNRAACKDIADLLTERSAALRQVYGGSDEYDCNAID